MKKSILFVVLILCLCLTFSSCLWSVNLKSNDNAVQISEMPNNTDINNSSSSAQNESGYNDCDYDIPSLSIEYKDGIYSAVTGTYSWNVIQGVTGCGIEADAGTPDVLIKYQEKPILIAENSEINLIFNPMPTNYEVKIWNTENYDLSQVIDNNDDKIIITKDQPFTIYEVVADFEFESDGIKQSGRVYYAFAVNQEIP